MLAAQDRNDLPPSALSRSAPKEAPAPGHWRGDRDRRDRAAWRVRVHQVGHLRRCRVQAAHPRHFLCDQRDDDPLGQAPRGIACASSRIIAGAGGRRLLPVRDPLRRLSRSRRRGAAGMGERPRAGAALPARRAAEVQTARAVLDRQERDQDDGNAVVAGVDVRRSDLGRRGVSRSKREIAAANLCAMARGRRVRFAFPSLSREGAGGGADFKAPSAFCRRNVCGGGWRTSGLDARSEAPSAASSGFESHPTPNPSPEGAGKRRPCRGSSSTRRRALVLRTIATGGSVPFSPAWARP